MTEQKGAYNTKVIKAAEVLALDYDGKIKLLEQIVRQLLDLQVEFAELAGSFAKMRAQITVLKEVKSALQSAIKAEQA